MSGMTENLFAYMEGFTPRQDEISAEILEEAKLHGIPVVGPVVGQWLYIMASVIQAGRILELGTGNGYSAVFLARASRFGEIITIE